MDKIKSLQTVCFTVVVRQGKKFLMLCLESIKKTKGYDNALYVEGIDLEAIPVGRTIRVIRGKNVFDSGGTSWYRPIPGEPPLLMLSFKKLPDKDKLMLAAKNFRVGDKVEIPWVLSSKDMQSLLPALAGKEEDEQKQEEITRSFIARFGFGKQGVFINEPFTVVKKILRP